MKELFPDVWQNGSIKGLRAIGGFEIVSMQWKDGKVIKVIIKSVVGGNLRLRFPNEMKLTNGTELKSATGENKNQFYQTEVTPAPVISPKAVIVIPELKNTWMYDISTQKGKTYSLEYFQN